MFPPVGGNMLGEQGRVKRLLITPLIGLPERRTLDLMCLSILCINITSNHV